MKQGIRQLTALYSQYSGHASAQRVDVSLPVDAPTGLLIGRVRLQCWHTESGNRTLTLRLYRDGELIKSEETPFEIPAPLKGRDKGAATVLGRISALADTASNYELETQVSAGEGVPIYTGLPNYTKQLELLVPKT